MSDDDRGALLIITAGGPNPPSASNTWIHLDPPVTIDSFQAGFSGVEMGGEGMAASAGILPPAKISLGGAYHSAMLSVVVGVPTGKMVINGTIEPDKPLPFPVKIQAIFGGSYTFPAGQKSGKFSLSFPFGSIKEARAKIGSTSVV